MKVIILKEGVHTKLEAQYENQVRMICPICSSVTLIKAENPGEHNILVDTGYSGFEEEIVESLKEKADLAPEDIQYIINTHEHFDHCANNHLFKNAVKITGLLQWDPKNSVEIYSSTESIKIQDGVSLISTPGHKDPHISVVVEADKKYVIAGDTIAKEFFLTAYEGQDKLKSAEMVLDIADVIIPGHGPVIEKEDFEKVRNKIQEYKRMV